MANEKQIAIVQGIPCRISANAPARGRCVAMLSPFPLTSPNGSFSRDVDVFAPRVELVGDDLVLPGAGRGVFDR